MCIVAVSWRGHPKWKLVALGNRDELHARPTTPLARWSEPDHILAGRDEEAGGTWLGVSEQGRFAVVTNVARSRPPDKNAASRGQLLRDFLASDGPCSDLHSIDYSAFNPFNLITVSGDTAHILSNQSDDRIRTLEPGLHGLSNGTLASPWPKSQKLNRALEGWLSNDAADFGYLLDQLGDQAPVTPSDSQATGGAISPRPEHSAIFINSPIYGTRCSSVVAIDQEGYGTFLERRFSNRGGTTGETRINFSWPA